MLKCIKNFRIKSGIGKPGATIQSIQCIDFIKDYEGFCGVVYKDAAGYETIGYGHRVKPGEDFSKGITEREGVALLSKDIKVYRDAVLLNTRVPLSRNQLDALISFTYNVGPANFANSTLLRKLNKGDYIGAADELPKWCRAGGKELRGLKRRREMERAIFLREDPQY